MLNALQLFANRRQRYDKTLSVRILSFKYSHLPFPLLLIYFGFPLVFRCGSRTAEQDGASVKLRTNPPQASQCQRRVRQAMMSSHRPCSSHRQLFTRHWTRCLLDPGSHSSRHFQQILCFCQEFHRQCTTVIPLHRAPQPKQSTQWSVRAWQLQRGASLLLLQALRLSTRRPVTTQTAEAVSYLRMIIWLLLPWPVVSKDKISASKMNLKSSFSKKRICHRRCFLFTIFLCIYDITSFGETSNNWCHSCYCIDVQ